MNSIIPTMTAQTPSIGMSARGYASAPAWLGTAAVKRQRHLGGFVADRSVVLGMATQGAFPGTTVWRPPTC